ncbi:MULTISPECIES: putative signal transducing protein [unclassified Micromonospora]|uniref:putative signal transducing protein n=1 Tax=Micromonospora sp. NPDC005206 TaxID=3157022 RepID=UPI0033A010A8
MEERTTVPLTVVGSRTEAELIVGLLRSYGLRAVVAADDVGGQEPHLQLQGVHVLIAADDEAAAREILAAVEQDGTDGPSGRR